ncbi:MAG: RidA family protein [Deltaproteobacteria bacterium]|nr:RidA family protein [Deltaproteobacteria bacterium]
MNLVSTADAPAAIGPYSQAIVHGDLVYCSGQIALDPATGQVIDGGVAEQTERVLDNLFAVLQAAGSGPGQVLKTTVYLRDMGDFAAMNTVYARRFGESRPARATVAVSGLPRDVRVEIDAIAAVAR